MTVWQLLEAQQTARIASVQNLYDLSRRTAEPLLEHAERHGIALIPALPLALVISAFIEIDLPLLILVIGGVSWTGVARIVRAEVLSLREREFVVGGRAIGARDSRLVGRYILVNAVPPIIVAATLQVATAILAESALSYLGYGIQPPVASWGNMLQNAQRYLRTAPELAVYPGLLISLTVVSINFLGDALRDALDPARRGAPNW